MRFAGGADEAPINGVEGVRAHFGDGPETDAYIALLKAVRAIVTVAEGFYLSGEGTAMEKAAHEHFSAMIDSLVANPNKTREVIEALVALIVHLKNGGTYEEWFEGLDA